MKAISTLAILVVLVAGSARARPSTAERVQAAAPSRGTLLQFDFINNTAWMNSTSPELQYAQIFAQDCDDVRIVNNILVAPVADVGAGGKPETVNGAGRCSRFVFAHNLYFSGNQRPLMGGNDRIADPLFVYPSTDPAKADFRLRSDSPALKAGRLESFSPITDLEGRLRPPNGPADLGAFQK